MQTMALAVSTLSHITRFCLQAVTQKDTSNCRFKKKKKIKVTRSLSNTSYWILTTTWLPSTPAPLQLIRD